MNKLKELINKCECSVSISIDEHKDYYESVNENISEQDREDIPNDVFKRMQIDDTVIRLQFYPRTPVSFGLIFHYDLDTAIDIALDSFNN